MKIISVTMIKDESDIVESFVRYNACFVDGMIFADHMSCDRTLEILNKLKDEGYPLWIMNLDKPEYNQAKVVNGMIEQAVGEQKADWVLPLDVDEFVGCVQPGVSPREALEAMDPSCVQQVWWRNYFPKSEDKEDDLLVMRRMQWCCPTLGVQHHKVFVSAQQVRQGVRVGGGSHRVVDGPEVSIAQNNDLFLAHYPLRSFEQIRKKVFLMVIAKQALETKPFKAAYLERIYNELLDGRAIGDESMAELLRGAYFVYDSSDMTLARQVLSLDFCNNMELKYTQTLGVDVQRCLLECAIGLAMAYAKAKKAV